MQRIEGRVSRSGAWGGKDRGGFCKYGNRGQYLALKQSATIYCARGLGGMVTAGKLWLDETQRERKQRRPGADLRARAGKSLNLLLDAALGLRPCSRNAEQKKPKAEVGVSEF